MQPPTNPAVWTAVNLSQVRTEVLQGLDLTRGPRAAADAVRDELRVRAAERRLPS
jgi:hypothetical protein